MYNLYIVNLDFGMTMILHPQLWLIFSNTFCSNNTTTLIKKVKKTEGIISYCVFYNFITTIVVAVTEILIDKWLEIDFTLHKCHTMPYTIYLPFIYNALLSYFFDLWLAFYTLWYPWYNGISCMHLY